MPFVAGGMHGEPQGAVSLPSLLSDPKAPSLTPVCALDSRSSGRHHRNMPHRRPYPSDLSDARWELIEPTLTAWRTELHSRGLHIGRPPRHDPRRIMDAIVYVDRTGIPWRYLPHDFPPWETVYGLLRRRAGRRCLRPAHRAAPPPGAGRRRRRCRAEHVRARRPEREDLRERADRRAGHRRRHEDRRPQAPPRGGHPGPPAGRARHRSERLATLPAAFTCSHRSPTPTHGSPEPGPTPATAPGPSTTAPALVSMSRSPAATPPRRVSRSFRGAGWSSGPSARSRTGAWPATTRPTRTAPKPRSTSR